MAEVTEKTPQETSGSRSRGAPTMAEALGTRAKAAAVKPKAAAVKRTDGKGAGDTLGTGRRKTSVARVRIRPGQGRIAINRRTLEDYFPREQQQQAVLAPLEQSAKRAEVDVIIRVHGGGITGQADACKLGIARALKSFDDERAQEVRAARRPPRHAVLEALIP
jgi:small subunit ribosomal protein S9